MLRKKKLLRNLLIIGVVILLYDNFSPFSKGKLTETDWGTNTDITDGRLSRNSNYQCVFIINGKDSIISGNSKQRIILKETDACLGIMSYIPFYKSIKPTIKFDCYLENPNQYIGKIEIEKVVTAVGITRNHLKKMIVNNYIKDCIAILNSKCLPYDLVHSIYTNKRLTYASVYCGSGTPKIRAILRDNYTGFTREIPIRDKEQVYTDTIFMMPDTINKHAKYEVFTVDKNRKQLEFKSIGPDGNTLYSGAFVIKEWPEDKTSYQSFTSFAIH